MPTITITSSVLAALILGIGIGYFIRQFVASQRKSSIEARLKKLAEDTRAQAKELLIEAKEKAAKTLDEAKAEERERLKEVRRQDVRLIERETAIDRRAEETGRKEKETEARIEKVKGIKAEW